MVCVYFLSIHIFSSVKEGQVESNYKNDERELKRRHQSLDVDVNKQTGTNLHRRRFNRQQTQNGGV